MANDTKPAAVEVPEELKEEPVLFTEEDVAAILAKQDELLAKLEAKEAELEEAIRAERVPAPSEVPVEAPPTGVVDESLRNNQKLYASEDSFTIAVASGEV